MQLEIETMPNLPQTCRVLTVFYFTGRRLAQSGNLIRNAEI
jgi:hypothetical protein